MMPDRSPDLAFDVRGIPVPQGTARAFIAGGKARLATDSNRPGSSIGAWRGAVAGEARSAAIETGWTPAAGPVVVHLWFRLPRPGSHYLPANGRRPVRELRLDAPEFVPTKPDVDKLTRACLDAMTGVVFLDDSQVVRIVAQKRYDDTPGVAVSVWRTA